VDRPASDLPTCPPGSTTTINSDCWVPHETTRGRPQAQRFLEQLVLGRTVQMAKMGRDRYGRTVATLAVGEHDVGFALLQAGLAWHDWRHHPPRLQGATGHYAEAQQRAVLSFAGLWSEPRHVAPWQWRAGSSQSRFRPHCKGVASRMKNP
jgi:endonuclease YncB( thermonuclease family)